MIARYLLCWLLLAIIAVGNGVLRERTYGERVSELAAHQISTVTGILFSGIFVWWLSRIWPIASARDAWIIGVSWLVMTVAFEFGFGHFVVGHSWSRLFADYDVLQGRIWLLFLIWVTIMPYVFYRLSPESA